MDQSFNRDRIERILLLFMEEKMLQHMFSIIIGNFDLLEVLVTAIQFDTIHKYNINRKFRANSNHFFSIQTFKNILSPFTSGPQINKKTFYINPIALYLKRRTRLLIMIKRL